MIELTCSLCCGVSAIFNSLVEYYAFNPNDPLKDFSSTMGGLTQSSIPPTYLANCLWSGANCAIFSSNSNSSGGGQWLQAPPINLGSMSAGAGFSICSWFMFGGNGSWSRIFDFGNGPASDNNLLAQVGVSAVLQHHKYCSSTNFPFQFPDPITLGQWRHVCIVNQGTAWTYFDNGRIVGTQQSCTLNDVTLSSNFLGRSNWPIDRLLQGRIGVFQIYSRALSASDVGIIYAYRGTKPECFNRRATYYWYMIHSPILFESGGANGSAYVCLRWQAH